MILRLSPPRGAVGSGAGAPLFPPHIFVGAEKGRNDLLYLFVPLRSLFSFSKGGFSLAVSPAFLPAFSFSFSLGHGGCDPRALRGRVGAGYGDGWWTQRKLVVVVVFCWYSAGPGWVKTLTLGGGGPSAYWRWRFRFPFKNELRPPDSRGRPREWSD